MRTLHITLLSLALLVTMSSCSRSFESFAVILWPATDSALTAGTVLGVQGESDATDSLILQDEEIDYTVERWRTAQFNELTAAENFSNEFERWKDSFARSLRTALPVRERPDETSTRIYRLRDGELMKVLDRTEEQVDVGGLVDYWYEVLTREGTTGWVFGHNLELTGVSGRALNPQETHDGTDRIVRDISAVTWRPAYFREMVRTGRIDLEQLAPRFGFFGDWDNREFRLVLPGLDRRFEYNDYRSADGRLIEFEGTDLSIAIRDEERLELQYLENGRRRSTTVELFEEEISVIVEAERERRRMQLEQFLQRGSGLVSTAYGTVRISDRGAVTWTGFERLVPGVLPTTFNGSGRFEFGIYLNDDLRGRYDGAVRLVAPENTTSFLYSFTDDGVRFVYVPSRLVEKQTVTAEPVSPVVIFFRFLPG